jgi:hypothetical protein
MWIERQFGCLDKAVIEPMWFDFTWAQLIPRDAQKPPTLRKLVMYFSSQYLP